MWEPNEQLLLRAPVRYKKQDGTLFVTPRRVAYQQQGSSQLTPSIYYNNIAGLAQTPESSPKVLLKISLKTAGAKDYTFQFTSAKNIQEREGIKSQIAELLARARGSSVTAATTTTTTPATTPATPLSTTTTTSTPSPTPTTTQQSSAISSPATIAKSPLPSNGSSVPGSPRSARQEEFNDRKALLTSSKELQTLHKELVVVGKSVDEEEFWASPYVKRIRQKLKKDALSREGKQKGKSSRMVELKPGQQEGTDIKYTLTSQIIHNIFTEFPSVKRAYDANVPDKMTEQVFWKRFLASEFFHRSRTGGRSQLAPYDDIFDRCLQEEDEENSRPPTMTRMERIRFDIDLSATQEDHIESGNAPDFTMKPGREAQSLPLIRRFNRHSMRVLETALNKPTPETSHAEEIEKGIIISELLDEKPPEKIILDIQDTRRYFESQTRGSDQVSISEEATKELLNGYKRRFEDWQPNMIKQVMTTGAADTICTDLTSTIKKKVKYSHKSSTDNKLPGSVQQRIQGYHSATNEILRHFWSSYEPYKPDKNNRMIEGLRRQQERLKEILISVVSYDGDPERCKQTLAPLMTAINKALEVSKKRVQKKR
ncbi:hypothetical protein G6F37_009903 [Rhizopus arrhizus]|nr:hypothetical protein G6F38_009973 [Rhizopus arrhizus]KAG1153943.1 hypothetical protein G6F37_009903 [Rhizopus arrhizus]